MRWNDLTERRIRAAIVFHRELGPVLLKSACGACTLFELTEQGTRLEHQMALPIVVRDVRNVGGGRVELLVETASLRALRSIQNVIVFVNRTTKHFLRFPAGDPPQSDGLPFLLFLSAFIGVHRRSSAFING
jgi:hypothetical protein